MKYKDLIKAALNEGNISIYTKASRIASMIGKEWLEDKHNHLAGKYYKNYVYEGYGFRIVLYDTSRNPSDRIHVTVDYNRQRVLDNTTYVHGPWENALTELYKSMPAILDKKRKEEDLYEKKEAIVDVLVGYPKEDGGTYIKGSDGKIVRVCSGDDYGGAWDHIYVGTEYCVYVNDELVFDAYRSRSADNNPTKHKVYVPGSWESTIRQGLKPAQDRAKQRKQQEEENEANDIIKQLRKLRGEN